MPGLTTLLETAPPLPSPSPAAPQVYVISANGQQKGAKGSKGGRATVVDPRLKKDKRAARGAAGGRGGKGGGKGKGRK